MGDQWFDQNNYVDPLQEYFSELIYPLDVERTVVVELFMMNNTLDLFDSYFGFGRE